ncbi:hypothetical protein GCM10029992_60900 [Glycomyces albus]
MRVAVEGDRAVGEGGHRRQEAHDGPGQAAVDVGPAAQRAGLDPPQLGVGGVDGDAEERSASTIRSVSRE